jgi:hypothetical protein
VILPLVEEIKILPPFPEFNLDLESESRSPVLILPFIVESVILPPSPEFEYGVGQPHTFLNKKKRYILTSTKVGGNNRRIEDI